MRRHRSLALAVVLLAPASLARADAAKPAPAKAAADHPCRAHRDFDFWVGDFEARKWDEPNGAVRGRLHNTLEYGGCVIVERWEGAPGRGRGMSMSFYDTSRRAWRMIWMGDDGGSNDFEGSYRNGAMRFEGWILDDGGKKLLASNVLENVSPGVIRHVYSESPDGGKTWNVRSDGRFVRIAR